MRMAKKFPEIEFLRFLAISSVVIYHFTARRAPDLPYGKWVIDAPWSLGWLGVELFFIVSGFVIAFSIEKTKSSRVFLLHRGFRLYPALFLLLPIVYFAQRFIPYSPFVDRSTLQNLFGSITLVPPTVLNFLTDSNFDWLTLVLWSLKVEVFFYLLCAVVAQVFSKKGILMPVTSLALLLTLIYILNILTSGSNMILNFITKVTVVFGFENLNWFAIGMLLYLAISGVFRKLHRLILVLVSIEAIVLLFLTHEKSFEVLWGSLFVILIAVLVLHAAKLGFNFAFKLPILIGNSSYEMYLLHQGVGIPILFYAIKTFDLTPWPSIGVAVCLVLFLGLFSHWIFKTTTEPINRWLRSHQWRLLRGNEHPFS
jgi:peptidoglycan/LPS O-acetylase OafA/YrhL